VKTKLIGIGGVGPGSTIDCYRLFVEICKLAPDQRTVDMLRPDD
jgi:aspartate/glutamate racemase